MAYERAEFINEPICRAARYKCLLTTAEASTSIEKLHQQLPTESIDPEISARSMIEADDIANLTVTITKRFAHSEVLMQKLDRLLTDSKYLLVPHHAYYRAVLRFKIIYKHLSADEIIKEIRAKNELLIVQHLPLHEGSHDMFHDVMQMPQVDVETGLQLLHEVDRLSEHPTYACLWRHQLLKSFMRKLSNDTELPDNRVEDIIRFEVQKMIDRHIETDYTPSIQSIVESIKQIKDKRKGVDPRTAINFPITSIHVAVRRQAWDYYWREGLIDSLHPKTLLKFIERETVFLQRHPEADRSYLLAAQQVQQRQRSTNPHTHRSHPATPTE